MWNMTTGSTTVPAALTLEWAPFTLAEGVDEAALLVASAALQTEFLSKQPGFVRRELLRGHDNQWVDVVYWSSRQPADEASRNAMNSPVCHRYFTFMVGVDHDDLEAGVSYFEHVASYAADDIAGGDAAN
jgi:hypothetical protein